MKPDRPLSDYNYELTVELAQKIVDSRQKYSYASEYMEWEADIAEGYLKARKQLEPLVNAAKNTIGERILGQIDSKMKSKALDEIEKAIHDINKRDGVYKQYEK